MDTRCAVGVEQESEDFSHYIVVCFTGFDIHIAFCTTVKLFFLTALSDFAPSCFVV